MDECVCAWSYECHNVSLSNFSSVCMFVCTYECMYVCMRSDFVFSSLLCQLQEALTWRLFYVVLVFRPRKPILRSFINFSYEAPDLTEILYPKWQKISKDRRRVIVFFFLFAWKHVLTKNRCILTLIEFSSLPWLLQGLKKNIGLHLFDFQSGAKNIPYQLFILTNRSWSGWKRKQAYATKRIITKHCCCVRARLTKT